MVNMEFYLYGDKLKWVLNMTLEDFDEMMLGVYPENRLNYTIGKPQVVEGSPYTVDDLSRMNLVGVYLRNL